LWIMVCEIETFLEVRRLDRGGGPRRWFRRTWCGWRGSRGGCRRVGWRRAGERRCTAHRSLPHPLRPRTHRPAPRSVARHRLPRTPTRQLASRPFFSFRLDATVVQLHCEPLRGVLEDAEVAGRRPTRFTPFGKHPGLPLTLATSVLLTLALHARRGKIAHERGPADL
jgi:hypothetical protein